jgi:hypothetical protein
MDVALECVVELLERHETALLQRLEDAASDADGETSVFTSEIDEATAAVLCRGGTDVDGDVVSELFATLRLRSRRRAARPKARRPTLV